jgi:hypothetical protein
MLPETDGIGEGEHAEDAGVLKAEMAGELEEPAERRAKSSQSRNPDQGAGGGGKSPHPAYCDLFSRQMLEIVEVLVPSTGMFVRLEV